MILWRETCRISVERATIKNISTAIEFRKFLISRGIMLVDASGTFVDGLFAQECNIETANEFEFRRLNNLEPNSTDFWEKIASILGSDSSELRLKTIALNCVLRNSPDFINRYSIILLVMKINVEQALTIAPFVSSETGLFFPDIEQIIFEAKKSGFPIINVCKLLTRTTDRIDKIPSKSIFFNRIFFFGMFFRYFQVLCEPTSSKISELESQLSRAIIVLEQFSILQRNLGLFQPKNPFFDEYSREISRQLPLLKTMLAKIGTIGSSTAPLFPLFFPPGKSLGVQSIKLEKIQQIIHHKLNQ